METYFLYNFCSKHGEIEFVVISDQPELEVIKEYKRPGVPCAERIEIDGNATAFPCDRELHKDGSK